MKIMYVEDNAVNLALIERIAQMNKHELVSYDEAEKALEVLEQGESVDLILLDIQLAGEMDGIAFAKAMREKGWKQPIIAITAYAMLGDKERILAAGCNEYLPKPLPIAEFLAMLAKYDPSNNVAPAAASTTPVAPAAIPAVAPTKVEETPTQPSRENEFPMAAPVNNTPKPPAIESPAPVSGVPQQPTQQSQPPQSPQTNISQEKPVEPASSATVKPEATNGTPPTSLTSVSNTASPTSLPAADGDQSKTTSSVNQINEVKNSS